PLELLAEGLRIDVLGERRLAPGAAARGQVSGQLVEALLHLGIGQELDQPPGVFLVARAAEDDEARAARHRGAGALGARHGRRHPAPLLLGRQTAPELADVPRPVDIERAVTAAELLPGAGALGVRDRRRPLAAEHLEIVSECPAES